MSNHRFQPGDCIKAKSSGKFYRVERLRSDDHHKLKGEIGYSVVGLRDGKAYGPVRLMRDSSFENTVYGGDEPPQPVDDGSCDPLYGQRMDSADCGEN